VIFVIQTLSVSSESDGYSVKSSRLWHKFGTASMHLQKADSAFWPNAIKNSEKAEARSKYGRGYACSAHAVG